VYRTQANPNSSPAAAPTSSAAASSAVVRMGSQRVAGAAV
jgi:hypothetical protein